MSRAIRELILPSVRPSVFGDEIQAGLIERREMVVPQPVAQTSHHIRQLLDSPRLNQNAPAPRSKASSTSWVRIEALKTMIDSRLSPAWVRTQRSTSKPFFIGI